MTDHPEPERRHASTIERACRDDEEFEAFVQQHQRLAFSIALRILRSPEAAADATQEAWVRAFSAWDRFQDGNRRAWLARIVTNVALDELRRRKRRPQSAIGDDAELGWLGITSRDDRPDSAVENQELHEVLTKAIRGLRPEWRTTVMLAGLEGMSYREVADTMGLPMGTVRSRLSRSRSVLRHALLAMAEADGYIPAGSRRGATAGRSDRSRPLIRRRTTKPTSRDPAMSGEATGAIALGTRTDPQKGEVDVERHDKVEG